MSYLVHLCCYGSVATLTVRHIGARIPLIHLKSLFVTKKVVLFTLCLRMQKTRLGESVINLTAADFREVYCTYALSHLFVFTVVFFILKQMECQNDLILNLCL